VQPSKNNSLDPSKDLSNPRFTRAGIFLPIAQQDSTQVGVFQQTRLKTIYIESPFADKLSMRTTMNRDELIQQIKAELLAELQDYKDRVGSHVPPEAREKVHEAQKATRDFVKENPLVAFALAAGLGFLLGRMLYRKEDE
jgi:ElaB/YqjD/DUF883 family membrane-anchored ribosome-binding protein